MVAKARELYARMREVGLHPTYVTFNSLIDVFVRCNEMPEAWRYFGVMRSSGLKPDNFTCSTLIKGIKPSAKQLSKGIHHAAYNHRFHGPHPDMQVAFDLLEQMTNCPGQFRERPDEVLLNCMIDMCVRFRDLYGAVSLFNQMDRSFSCHQSSSSYSNRDKHQRGVRSYH